METFSKEPSIVRLVDANGNDLPIQAVNLTVGRVLVVMPADAELYLPFQVAEKLQQLFEKYEIPTIVLSQKLQFIAVDVQ